MYPVPTSWWTTKHYLLWKNIVICGFKSKLSTIVLQPFICKKDENTLFVGRSNWFSMGRQKEMYARFHQKDEIRWILKGKKKIIQKIRGKNKDFILSDFKLKHLISLPPPSSLRSILPSFLPLPLSLSIDLSSIIFLSSKIPTIVN